MARPQQKQRFVWSPDLRHLLGPLGPQQTQRFVWSPDLRHEAAVAELRLEQAKPQAKPQAIVQIMDLHGENAPTRLSITSHLQSEGCAHAEARRDRAQDGRYKFDTKSKAPPPPKQGAIRGSGSTEMASPAGTPTGVPQQGVAGRGGGAVGGGGGNGGTASARLPTSRGGASTHVDVVAAAWRSRAGRSGICSHPWSTSRN